MEHKLGLDAPLADWIAAKEEYGTDADSESESECESKAYGNTYTIPDRAGSTRSSSSNQDSSSDDSYGSGSGDRKKKKQKKSYTKAAEISQAVNEAFQENMSSFKQDFEAKLSSMKNEIEKLDNGRIMQGIADDIQKLSTAEKENLACFNKISQLAKISSESAVTISNISACQKKQNSIIDTNSTTLVELKHQLKAVHVQNEQYSSTQAKGMERVGTIETNQTKILELLSSLKENNDSVQDRLEILEVQGGATEIIKNHEGATFCSDNNSAPPSLEKSSKGEDLEGKIESNAKMSPINGWWA